MQRQVAPEAGLLEAAEGRHRAQRIDGVHGNRADPQPLRDAVRLRVGTVSVNTVDALSPMTPFGGFKQSGFGRDLSLHALDKYTALKTTWIKYRRAAAT